MLRLLLAFLIFATSAFAQITNQEFAARRARAMDTFKDGILLVQAGNDLSLFSPGFQQRPDFYYFTGLGNQPSVILAIDGPRHESWLFLPHKLSGLAALATAQQIAPIKKTTGIEHVTDWDDFATFLDHRLKSQDKPVIYTSTYHWSGPETVPPSLSPNNDPDKLLVYSIKSRWPSAIIKSAEAQLDELRIALSPAEIATSRRVGQASAQALLAAMHATKPGTSQRTVEAAVVTECFRQGADSIAFWPWAMSGANAAFPKPFEAFVDYRSLNREMRTGELVRLDVGCAIDHYRGDVGRTVPVSGHFDEGQREAWNIFVEAYRAGLAVIKDGVTRDDVFNAWQSVARRHLETANTPLAQALVGRMLRKEGTQYWEIHGVGLIETPPPPIFRAGMIFALEPIVTADERGFYLEDTILITKEGYENLTPDLPYTAEQIERAMSK